MTVAISLARELTRADAVAAAIDGVEDELVFCATGMISREAFAAGDRARSFYTIGSMGLVASLGLGAALARPDERVLVLDGDGSVLMGMGGLAMIAERAPRNLTHVVLDNGTYGSTGDQRAISDAVPLDEVARACGYAHVVQVDSRPALERELRCAREADGPVFVHVRVAPGNVRGIGRVTLDPEEIARRFRESVS